ncbi:MAG TPA: hypothetical protein VGM54_26810 [Chthoniobacter sp.]|jgi:hypothetical protein
MSELIFEVTRECDGGFVAECLTESIVTEADTWEVLRLNVREVVKGYYFDAPEKAPDSIHLHLLCESPENGRDLDARLERMRSGNEVSLDAARKLHDTLSEQGL